MSSLDDHMNAVLLLWCWQVVVLDTSAAKRGVLSVGVSNVADLAGEFECIDREVLKLY